MNDLEKYFKQNTERQIHKWSHYFDIYERHFAKFRNKEIVMLEIGIDQGGSLQMWKNYFGSKAKIYGIDINPICKDFEEENIEIFIGSQSDRNFLRNIKKKIPSVDILIDDGGHTMRQQIITFEEMFDHVKDNGIYLCEDNHTSYWIKLGGGYKRRGTFIEFTKKKIDDLHAFHSRQKKFKVNKYTKNINSIHYYDSIVVFEKNRRKKPHDSTKGNPSFNVEVKERTILKKIYDKIIYISLLNINRLLSSLKLSGFMWK